MDYVDFEVSVRGGVTGYVVEVRSPAGEAEAPFTLERPDPFPSLLAAAQQRSLDATEAQEVGSGLFDALLPGPIRERYRESLGMVRERGARLVISFRCDVPDIAAVPWEFLYDPVEARFLAASLETSFARYVPLPARQRTVTVRPPLRLLLVASAPAGLPPLDVDGELSRIRSVLRPLQEAGQLEVRLLQHATPESLREDLAWGPHLLHVVCHGQRGSDGIGELVLEDKYGDPLVLSAADLASLLNETEVRCLVLMACHTASGGGPGGGPFSGLGPALVRAGVASVVTLQQELPDKAAVEFSTAFYRAIADGQSVGVAINVARRDMRAAGGQQRGEWATPVLHTRYPGGQVFVSPGGAGGTVRIEVPPEELRRRAQPVKTDEHKEGDTEPRDRSTLRLPPPRALMAGGAIALVLLLSLLAWRTGVFGAAADTSPTPTLQAAAPTSAAPAAAAPTAPEPTSVPTPTAEPTLAPTPAPTASTTSVLLSDSLGGPQSTAVPGPSASTNDYQFGFELSEYLIGKTNASYPNDVIAPLVNLGADTAMTIDARLGGPLPGRYIELGCRQQASSTVTNPTGYALLIDPSGGRFKLLRADGARTVDLVPWQQSMDIFPGTADNQVELDCIGTTIRAWINGTQIVDETDGTYRDGRLFIGVGVDSSAEPGTVEGWFKNLMVASRHGS